MKSESEKSAAKVEPHTNIRYNYIMPRHFSNLWNGPKSFNKKDITVEQKINKIIQNIKFWIWAIFKK
jgi:hypothetical protein